MININEIKRQTTEKWENVFIEYTRQLTKQKAKRCPFCPLFNEQIFLTFPEDQPWGRILVNCPNCGVVFNSTPYGHGNRPVDLVILSWNHYVKTII